MSGYAWVTLATNDSYSLGALVLAHSLKKCNTIHKLAVLITPAVSQPMREQLQSVFNVVKVVDVLDSKDEANLALLKRPELGITFTKIHCWMLTEFAKCVFLDADTLVVRNCDELFEREEFSAAPDVGWPDCFNSGVFVYKPSVTTFNEILKFAVEKGSYDGGDQGLLNQYFGKWATEDIRKHLPFVYNLTTIAVYSYIPAFKHYGSETRIVHFIGAGKPWLQKLNPATRKVAPAPGSEHLTPLLQNWWDLFTEKVHPKLDKNLDFANGVSSLPKEACSNNLAVESETPDLCEPLTSYRQPNDFRQFNLPYRPVVVKDFSGKTSDLRFLPVPAIFLTTDDDDSNRKEQERENETQLKEETVATFERMNERTFDEMEEEKTNETESKRFEKRSDTVDGDEFQRMKETNQTDFFENVKKTHQNLECLPTELKIKPIDKSVTCDFHQRKSSNTLKEDDPKSEETITEFRGDSEKEGSDYDNLSFLKPDEECISNYLEKNVEVYQPLQNQVSKQCGYPSKVSSSCSNEVVKKEESSQPVPPLPRFLTIPEGDKRQSGNCSLRSSSPPVNKLTKEKFETANLNLKVSRKTSFETYHNTIESENSNFPAVEAEDPFVGKRATEFPLSSHSIITKNQGDNFLKLKSKESLEKDSGGSSSESSTAGSTSEAKHPSKNFRKYSLPKLRPLLPKQSFVSKNKASFIPKITHYTEFLMSSEYKEPVDLPKDKIGFVESHISSIGQESDVVLAGGKFGPIPYTSPANVEESSAAISPKKPFKQLVSDPELYNLKACRRQLGNKPKEHSLPKTTTHIFPALKPLLPLKNKKSIFNKKRKSNERPPHLVEKRIKKRSEPCKCNKEEKRSIISMGTGTETTVLESSSTQKILKRLFNFSKDYLHYFGKENDKSEVGKRSPFPYEDYDSTKLKEAMRSAWSHLKAEATASSDKMVLCNNVKDIPAGSLIADKNISNKRFTVGEKIEEKAKSGCDEIKRVRYLTAVLEKQKPAVVLCKELKLDVERDSDFRKSLSDSLTEIVLLRTARIWRKKFQILLAAVENFKNDQVEKKFIIPLTWKERYSISGENFAMRSIKVIEERPREKIISKESDDCNNSGTDVSEERSFPKNVNKSQGSPVTEIDLIKGLSNCSGGSQVLRESGNTTKPSPRIINPTYSVNLNGFACSGDAHKYDRNINESTDNVAKCFDKRQHPTENKSKATNLKKKTIKKQIEPSCVPSCETPRSSRVDVASKEPVSDISNEMVTAAVAPGEEEQEETPLQRCFLVPAENSKISVALSADSHKTLPLNVSLWAPATAAAKRNDRLNRGKKFKSREIPPDKFRRETFDVAPNAQFADYLVSPCRECLVNGTIFEAAEPKHEIAASGLARTIAQLNVVSGDRKESSESQASSAYQDYMRRQNWETGNMDYMGKDSFDNIWSKICENINKKELEDLKGNVEILKAGDQNVSLESQMGKLKLKSEKEVLSSVAKDGMSPTKTQPGKQTEMTGKIPGQPNKEILPNVEKPAANNNLSKNLAQSMASDKQVPSPLVPAVQPAGVESSREPNSLVCSNVPGTDLKTTSCESPILPKTTCLAGDTKSPPVVQQGEAKAPQPVKPPLITETPATPISEKKENEPKLSPAARQQEEPPKESTTNAKPSHPVTPDAKQILPDPQDKVDSSPTKEEAKPNLINSQTANISAVPVAPNLGTKTTSQGQVTPTTPTPESKTKEPIASTLTNSTVTQIETKPKEPTAAPPVTTLVSTLPTSPLPTTGSVEEPKLNAPASAEAAKLPPAALPEQPKDASLPQQIMTSATNKGAKEAAPLAAAVDASKIAPQIESKLKPEQQLQGHTESPPTNKPASESGKQECGVKLSDILEPKGPAGTEGKDKPQAQTQEQGKNTAVVPYCDVLKQAQGPEENVEAKEKQKPRSQRSIEELKKRQSEIKASQLPPIALPDSPVKTQPDLPQNDGKIESSQAEPQKVTTGENKDPCPKTTVESSLKDNGKQKKGVFSKILEIVGVSPKEKKEDQTESSKSVFYDCEGIPSAGKKQDILKNESSIKTVSEVPEKSAADATKRQGEKTSTKANEEGVPTSKFPLDEAKTTNIDKTKDVNCDKKKTSNMLQSETEGGNKQKGKETQPKQEDSQSGNKKNKSKAKPPRNNAPSPPTKTEETKQPDNKDKKKESPNAKTGQKQEPKAAEVLAPSTKSKEAKDSSAKPDVAVAESKIKEDPEKKVFAEENIKSDLDDILNKAKTEVEARIQEKKQEGGEGVVPGAGEEVNTMKLIVGEKNKTENQATGKKDTKNVQQNKQKPQQKDAKFNKRGPQGGHQPPPPSGKMEEIEEVKVTSEEERKKHKGQVTSSKLSDQILKAIPPPRRKAISESKGDSQNADASDSEKASSEATVPPSQQQQQQPKLPTSENAKPESDESKPPNAGEATPAPATAPAAGGKPLNATENVKQTNASQADSKKGEGKGKTSSGPVPPPRNRPKPAQPTTQKNKSKK